MNAKEREQFLLMFLPACLVVITYAIFFYSPARQAERTARSQLEEVRQKAATPQDLLTARNRLQVATQERATLQQQVASQEAQIIQYCVSFSSEARSFQTIQTITAWLQEHPLSLITQATEREPTLSTAQRETLEQISSRLAAKQLQYRQFQLQGTYPDMVQFLQRFANSETPIYPVSLEMTASVRDDGQHLWSFVVVL